MATVSISEAARLTGKSTKTLYRLASQGKLSLSLDENGAKKVDTSELVRVFGEFKQSGENPIETDSESRVRQLEAEISVLRQAAAQLDVLKAEKAGLEALNAAREQQLQDMRQALRLIESQIEVPPTGQKRRRWWQFGK
ncbi:DNA-binding protein [Paraburkholderia sp. A1RI-2L]|uniref:DNA-binding protein n=1 Tax=Paraburkholderia sp. A1RI-2L TaxID=3028367 RepID=UPI003B7BFF7C